MTALLNTLIIENFRSLKGEVVIPLEAQVVLLHGSNGMGKTSVLSALELALTGEIAHLHRTGKDYFNHLLVMGAGGGSISLTVTGPTFPGGRADAEMQIHSTGFRGTPLLAPEDAKFFSERCYLPQATLDRLLEIYEDAETNETTSPLTRFVKDLLGLDQLDALIDGLKPVFHIARIRNLVPEYRRFENLQNELKQEVQTAKTRQRDAEAGAEARRATMIAALNELYDANDPVSGLVNKLVELRGALENDGTEDRQLIDLRGTRAELESLRARWGNLPQDLAAQERRQKQAEVRAIRVLFAEWQKAHGERLTELVTGLADLFSELPSAGDDPDLARSVAEQRAVAERDRCKALLDQSKQATTRLEQLDNVIQRASARVNELNSVLEAPARDAQTLAKVLAGIVPHVRGEMCPICDRDFSETGQGPLTAHIAANIAALTSQAGRLQELVHQRAEEGNRLTAAQRERMSVENAQLVPADIAALTVRRARLDDAVEELKKLAAAAQEGTAILRRQAAARESLASARRRDELVTEITADVDRWSTRLTKRALAEYESVEAALNAAFEVVNEDADRIENRRSKRITAIGELDFYSRHLEEVARHAAAGARAADRLSRVNAASRQVDQIRDHARRISQASETARTNIVSRVFNTSLNKIWRDLFIRLAPSEQFVPAFRIPEGKDAPVEAILETVHRSGARGGSPGAMLSHSNLNTAALTLFLALHLSITARLPWLILDDPVQSMDDLHISQFAALLRTLSKTLGQQIIVAVHERALFDYLTLELNPAFPNDGLITIELSRTLAGDSVATPRALTFTPDRAIAA